MTKEGSIIKVALVENDETVRESLSDMLTYDGAYEVIDSATTIEGATELFDKLAKEDIADLVLVDIGLDDGNLPLEYVKSLAEKLPFTHVVVSSAGYNEGLKGSSVSIIKKTNLNNIREYIPRIEAGEIFQEP